MRAQVLLIMQYLMKRKSQLWILLLSQRSDTFFRFDHRLRPFLQQFMLASLRTKDIFEYLVLHLARKDTLYDRLRLLRFLSLGLSPLEVVVDIIIDLE